MTLYPPAALFSSPPANSHPHSPFPLAWKPWRFGIALATAGPGGGR